MSGQLLSPCLCWFYVLRACSVWLGGWYQRHDNGHFYFLSFITAIIDQSCFCRDIANAKSCFYILYATDKSLRSTEQDNMLLLSCSTGFGLASEEL